MTPEEISSLLHRRKIDLWIGNTIEVTGIILGLIILFSVDLIPYYVFKLLALLFSWFCFWYFSHCIAHYIVGKILNINFLYYYVGRSGLIKLELPIISHIFRFIPVLGIKIDRASLRKVSKQRIAIMYISGALASMLCPLVSLTYSLINLDYYTTLLIGILTLTNILFTLHFSSKVGDFSKAMNVLCKS